MEIDNELLVKNILRIYIELMKYDFENGNVFRHIKNLEEFINTSNDVLDMFEDVNSLNMQIKETSTQLNKITTKYNNVEEKCIFIFKELEQCRTKLQNSNNINEKLKLNIEELFSIKSKNEKIIEMKNQKIIKISKKYNENMSLWKNILIELEKKVDKYDIEKKTLIKDKNKYLDEIESIKKILSSKMSSETIDNLNDSIVDMIDKANEYQKKYNDVNNEYIILKNNYDEINNKYNDLFTNQTKETNELKNQIKILTEQLEQEKLKNNEKQIVKKVNEMMKGGGEIKYFDIRDKKAQNIFEKDIKLFNEKQLEQNNVPNKIMQSENQPISYSTDYMVDYLKVNSKLKSNDNDLDTIKEIEINEHTEEEEPTNIFIKKTNDYYDVNKLKIFKSEIRCNKDEIEEFIRNNQNTNIVYTGGGKHKGKIEILDINGKLKMKINDNLSTLTEQNIDLKNENLIKKTKHRKYMRHNREQKKQSI